MQNLRKLETPKRLKCVIIVIFIFSIMLSGLAFAAPGGKPGRKDKTPPTTPLVLDEGQYTTSLNQLHATWSSGDPESGIAEFQYSIGTAVGLDDVVDWTSVGLATEMISGGLSLTTGQAYYFNVKAKNSHNLWSEIGFSDGITVLPQGPGIVSLLPANNSTFTAGNIINIAVQAQGSSALEYRYLVDGAIVQDWNSLNTHSYQTQLGDIRNKIITVEVKDEFQATASQDINVFLFRRVPRPE
ncbi:MAG: hypothetical protein V1871_03065 [Planctomycetota bacterium]